MLGRLSPARRRADSRRRAGPLTVVSGRPGAGKTMALACWAASRGPQPVAWVSLDCYDNQPEVFWSYLVEALREAGVEVSGAASALAHGGAPGYALLLRLASALATHDPPVILVLDDLHLITDPATLAGLDYVLRNARPGLVVVVASRIDPLLPLHRYRLAGDLSEIRAGDLAFSISEAALLMAQHGITLPAESLEFVTIRNEGWAAGLRMAAIAMDGHPDPEQFVKNLVADDSAIAGYLVEEVLNAQPPAARDLLLSTSAIIRLTVARRCGDFHAAADAAAGAEVLLDGIPESVRARRPEVRAQVLLGRGAVELWSGKLDTATAILGTAAAAAPRASYDAATCHGYLALIEALRGELSRAAELAAGGTVPHGDGRAGQLSPAAAIAFAYVHLEQNDRSSARGQLKSAAAGLRAHPDKLIGAVAYLVAARASLAQGRAHVVAGMARRARKDWSPPPWLGRMLSLAESQACAAAGDSQAAIAAASRAGADSSPDATVALARAWLAAGNLQAVSQALADPGKISPNEAQDRVRLDAWLTDAHISYRRADPARERQSLEQALRLGEPHRLRLPFAMERAWIRPALRRHPDLAEAYRDLLGPGLAGPVLAPATPPAAGQLAQAAVEELSNRELDVLRLASAMFSTAEIAADLCISVNTVKTYLKNIFRKLGVAHRGEAVRRARQLGLL